MIGIGQRRRNKKRRNQSSQFPRLFGFWRDQGRFPFDQKFRKFRVWERMEHTFSGISFRNFGCTSRGWPKIPENRNNRKIPFHSTIPQCSRPVSQSPEIELNMASNSSAQYQCSACYYVTGDLNVLLHHFCTGAGVGWQLAQIHFQVVSFLWA